MPQLVGLVRGRVGSGLAPRWGLASGAMRRAERRAGPQAVAANHAAPGSAPRPTQVGPTAATSAGRGRGDEGTSVIQLCCRHWPALVRFDQRHEVLSQSGAMFWLSRKKFVGSYLRLSAFRRSYFSVP
jgi:hypothetical protein